jgi:hypothetical protein
MSSSKIEPFGRPSCGTTSSRALQAAARNLDSVTIIRANSRGTPTISYATFAQIDVR